MNTDSSKNQNISSPKKNIFKIDISEKPLEQTSIILPSSDAKQNSDSLQNSSSNIFQTNNIGLMNSSNEDINFSEFHPTVSIYNNEIIVPSEENDNEEENTNRNIIQNTIQGGQKLSPEEIENKINESKNIKVIQTQGPYTNKIVTTTKTTISNNGEATVTTTTNIEKNEIENNNINNNSIKKEIVLPTLIEKISKTEIKENKIENKNEKNLFLNSEPKKPKKYSENEEEYRTQKILFGSNVKYDFDNSRNEEEDEKELLKNKFENLGKTPDVNDKIDSINNIAEIKQNIKIFDSKLFKDMKMKIMI